jgi:hypothetical protein
LWRYLPRPFQSPESLLVGSRGITNFALHVQSAAEVVQSLAVLIDTSRRLSPGFACKEKDWDFHLIACCNY